MDGNASLAAVSAAVAAGVDWLQVRDRSLDGDALLARVDALGAEARAAAERCGRSVRILVNRRGAAAPPAGPDGVHLGFDGLAPADARRLLGAGALVGISCHAPSEVGNTAASYAHLAPIFPPLSKAPSRPPLGTAALGAAHGLPVLAQGGITPENAAACVAAGAAGVAVTGAVMAAPDPGRAAAALRRELDGAGETTQSVSKCSR